MCIRSTHLLVSHYCFDAFHSDCWDVGFTYQQTNIRKRSFYILDLQCMNDNHIMTYLVQMFQNGNTDAALPVVAVVFDSLFGPLG